MIIYPKKQQGGTLGKAGRLHVTPTDRSAVLNYNPQVREIKAAGPTTQQKKYDKMYQGMLPSDQAFIQHLKDSKMQEIQDKYSSLSDYEGSQDNINDLEEYRDYDAGMSVNGKHYATQFAKNSKLASSRKAEGSIAALDGNVLAQNPDGSYDIVSYEELLTRNPDGSMGAQPLTIGDAIILRQSDPNFNSFGELGKFVDNTLMNTYNPDDLTKSMKSVASQAKMSKVMLDSRGNHVNIEDVISDIASSGGISATLKTNRDKVHSLAAYFRSIMNPNAANFLHNKAVTDIYKKVASGQLELQEGQNIQDVIRDYEAETIANYFYGAVGEELGLLDKDSGKGGGAQKKYSTTPLSTAMYRSAGNKIVLDLPDSSGTISRQEYNGAFIPQGNMIFDGEKSYKQGDEDEGIEGKTVQNNRALKMVGGPNMDFMALADGTILDDAVGLNKVTVPENGSYYMVMAPVKSDASGKGGVVPAFNLVTTYQDVINRLREMYALGQIETQADVRKVLDKTGVPNDIDFKPFLAFDVILKDNEDIDDRLLTRDGFELPEDITDAHEDAVDYNVGDKKLKQAKAFMVVDNPEVFANINLFKDYIGLYDASSAEFMSSGPVSQSVGMEDVRTYDATPVKKHGGKAPNAGDIHKLLFED
jgi:hypothetical protein